MTSLNKIRIRQEITSYSASNRILQTINISLHYSRPLGARGGLCCVLAYLVISKSVRISLKSGNTSSDHQQDEVDLYQAVLHHAGEGAWPSLLLPLEVVQYAISSFMITSYLITNIHYTRWLPSLHLLSRTRRRCINRNISLPYTGPSHILTDDVKKWIYHDLLHRPQQAVSHWLFQSIPRLSYPAGAINKRL